jgi:pantetheine-phosphate adenylyltransferase
LVKAIYPGTFDPVTNGHVDLVQRAAMMFDEVIVGVVSWTSKRLMFTTEERVNMFAEAVRHVPNVRVVPYRGLTVEFAKSVGATVIVRGLRIGSDFDYEREMALMNRDIGDIETACLLSSLEYQYVSSSRVKEIAALGADVSRLIPANVRKPLSEKLRGAGAQ